MRLVGEDPLVNGVCKGAAYGTATFFPAPKDLAANVEANRICRSCRVREVCLSIALEGDECGVWGGVPEDLRVEYKKRGLSPAKMLRSADWEMTKQLAAAG